MKRFLEDDPKQSIPKQIIPKHNMAKQNIAKHLILGISSGHIKPFSLNIFIFLMCLIMGASFNQKVYAFDVKVGVIKVNYSRVTPTTRLDEIPDNDGFIGGELGDQDNQTTGSFLGVNYQTKYISISPFQINELKQSMDGISLFIVLAKGEDLLKIANVLDDKSLIINAMSEDSRLRGEQCLAQILHIVPSRNMRADAVAQFAVWKNWSKWLLVHGSHPDDKLLAEAYRQAAKKFGASIVAEKEFVDTGGHRRTDTGHVLVQKEMPVFMQDTPEHDVVITADESDVFSIYLPYHQWSSQIVMGSSGLRAVTFHPAHEAWGATQFQTRFEKVAKRFVRENDYQTWLALRAIGEAVTRTNSADARILKEYMLSDNFELAAFKGQPVSFRHWNGQLRQPILLFDGRITVSVSPQDKFLHERSLLDSLGTDEPESQCEAFKK